MLIRPLTPIADIKPDEPERSLCATSGLFACSSLMSTMSHFWLNESVGLHVGKMT